MTKDQVENDTVVETKEILDSVKLDKPESPKIKSEVKEIQKKTKEEKVEEDLFTEFSSFLKDKTDIIPDIGEKKTISTGLDLMDAILGGGFAVGALNIVVGSPGSGKTMLAIKTMGKAQKQYKGKLLSAFLDSEEATTTLRLSNLGVRFPKIQPYVDITVEKVFKFIEGLSVFKQEKKIVDTPSIVVWDSIANTLSQKERETNDPNTVIGYKARLLSILVPKYLAKCAQNNICFLAINQLRDKLDLGMFSAPNDLKLMTASKTMPGGNVLKFNAFQLVEMKPKSIIAPGKAEDSNKYGFEGVIVKCKCVKNKLFSPNVEIEIVGSFQTGFSNFWTNYNFLKLTKRIKAGAWNSLVILPETKFRVKDAKTTYETDEKFKVAWDKSVKEAIETEIIDKYNPEI